MEVGDPPVEMVTVTGEVVGADDRDRVVADVGHVSEPAVCRPGDVLRVPSHRDGRELGFRS